MSLCCGRGKAAARKVFRAAAFCMRLGRVRSFGLRAVSVDNERENAVSYTGNILACPMAVFAAEGGYAVIS